MNNQIQKTEKKKQRVALYLRVSTDEQAKEGHYGLEVQEERGRLWCESQEYSLAEEHIYRDDISGGLPVEKRPALSKLFIAARQNEFDVVVVYKIDRMSRGLRILLNAIHELSELNIGFRSVSEAFETSSAYGRANVNMFGMFAELEKEMIRERTMNGKLKAAKSGKWVTGIPPYGYKVDKVTRKLVLVPEEAKVVEKIFYWLVYEKLSLNEIERRMNQMKIPTPYSTKVTKRETQNFWFKRSIARMLSNEVYTGTFYYRKYKRPYNNITSVIESNRQRPKEDWVPMTCDAIISNEMFEGAKKQLLHNREFARRNLKRDYLYSKLIWCSKCDFKMFGGFQPPKKQWEFSGGQYYHGIYRKEDSTGTSKRCEWCPVYSEARLEPIWECLKEILKNPKNMLAPLERYVYKEIDPTLTKTRLEEIDVALSAIERKQLRASELYVDEHIAKPQYDQYLNEYKRDIQKLNDEATLLRQSLLTKKEKTDREQVVKQAYEHIKDKLENVSREEKAKIISFFIERITLHAKEDYAEVVFKFPEHTQAPKTKNVNMTPQEGVKIFPLVLNIRTISEEERRMTIFMATPGMYKPKILI